MPRSTTQPRHSLLSLIVLILVCISLHTNAATLVRQVGTGTDDAEENVNSGSVGTTSSDLEINFEGGEPQLVALQFRDVDVLQGSTICSNTYIEFEADESNKEVTSLFIYGDDSDDASNLSDTDFDISNRTSTTAQVSWSNVPAWVSGNTYQTPSIRTIVQEIVDRGGWDDGNDMVLIVIGGGGSRVAESRDGNGDEPLLHIEYDNGSGCGSPATEEENIDNDNRDSEENATTGNIDRGSSDLEFVHEGGDAQLVGLRFTNITVPSGATITSASIQFTADESDQDSTRSEIFGVLNSNPTTFGGTNNISTRTRTTNSKDWIDIPAWLAGQSGSAQKTPDLTNIIQELINQGGWASGNSMAFVLEGWGERTAESFDGGSGDAPEITINYIVGIPGEANIAVTKADSIDPVPVNTNYNYDIEVTNFGPETATAVTLTDVLPGPLSFVSVFTDQGTCSESSGTVSCSIGTILSGNTVAVTIFVTAPGTAQTINNTVSIAASSTDSQTADNSATEDTFVGGNTEQLCYVFSDGSNRLSLYDTAMGTVTDYAANGTNSIEAIGWDSANEILYGADRGQLGILSQANGSWSTIGSGFGTASGSLGNINLNDVDGMAFNAFNSANVLYGVHERSGQDVLFQINTTTGTFIAGAFAGNDYVPLQIISGNNITDDIAVDITNGQMYAAVNNGGSTDRLIKINKANGTATDLALITIADVEGLGSDPSGQLWGTSGTRDTVFEIDKSTGTGSNERALNFSDYEAVDCVGVSPTVGADLFVQKLVDDNTPAPGQDIVYAVSITNNGAADSTGIQLSDTLPAQVTYVSHAASQGNYNPVSGFWFVGGLNSGQTRTLDITVTVTTPLGNSFSNTAAVSSASQPDPNTGNNSASIPVTVSAPVLTIVKTSNTPTASPGEVVTYTVLVTNTGNEVATSVEITDKLPPVIAFGFHTYADGVHFQFTDSGSGLTMGTSTFDNGGATFAYPPPAGPTQAFDANVTDFKIPLTGSMAAGSASFTLQYQVKLD